jgi:hypothetical protein
LRHRLSHDHVASGKNLTLGTLGEYRFQPQADEHVAVGRRSGIFTGRGLQQDVLYFALCTLDPLIGSHVCWPAAALNAARVSAPHNSI